MIEPVPRLLAAHEVVPAPLSDLQRLDRDRLVAAKERQMLEFLDVRVTVDGPETPAVVDVAEQLRRMIAETDPGPVLMVGPPGNRRQRRAAAARQRGRT